MLRGEPIWHTSSTGPMSMPSSSEAVATSAARSPARRRASSRCRRSLERLPWWAATRPSPSRSPRRCATRSARRRVFTKTSVVRCARTWPAIRSRISPHCSWDGTASSSLSGSSMARSSVRAVAEVDDAAGRAAVGFAPLRARADQEARHRLDRALGGREPDPLGSLVGEGFQALQREGEVRAALVPGDRVDLVHDDGPHAPEPLAAPFGRDEEIERLGRGDEEVGGLPEHGRARGRGRVAGPDDRPELGHLEAELARDRADLRQRALEVLPDVGGQRLQRRDVDDLGQEVPAGVGLGGPEQLVDPDEKGRQGLAGAGRRRDQRVGAAPDRGPAAPPAARSAPGGSAGRTRRGPPGGSR